MRSGKRLFPTVWLATAVTGHALALAQTPGGTGAGPSPEDAALDALRTRTEIPPGDRAIEAWISSRLEALNRGVADETPDVGIEFTRSFLAQMNHAQSTDAFKMRFAEQAGKRFATEFQKDDKLEPRTAEALGLTLLELRHVATLDGLIAGLKARHRPVVRYYAARALAQLTPDIQADQARTGSVLQVLREAGVAETKGHVLARIYEAMFYRERLALALPAILDVMQAQLKRRDTKEQPGADGADETVLAFLRRELANIQDKGRLIGVLAAHLRLDVERYRTPGLQQQESRSLERTIDAVESLLVQAASPPNPAPNVREAMKKLDNQDINMPLELYKWIGTAQSSGVLNGPPWNVAVGAPLPG